MAKAQLKKLEPALKQEVGLCIDRAISLAGKTQKECWVAMGHNDGAQLNRWIAGTERPQFDVLFAIDWLQKPLVIALAKLVKLGVEVVTEIRLTA